MDELISDFVLETRVRLDRAEAELAVLARDPTDADAQAELARTLHTIKGTCAFFGLDELGDLAHAGEDLLAALTADGPARSRDAVARLSSLARAVRRVLEGVAGARSRLGSEGDPTQRPSGLPPVWARFPRLVRELEQSRRVEVGLDLLGPEADLEPRLVEAVLGPLTHLVRNACVHGIEPPSERVAAGKPRAGRLLLRARATPAEVLFEVEDDGRGVDLGALRALAPARGWLSAEEAAAASQADLVRLLFRAGVSTAPGADRTAGRGVGLDAVRVEVERAGGEVALETRSGRGCTARIRLPRRRGADARRD